MLFIDIGNTRIKTCKNQQPFQLHYIEHNQVTDLCDIIDQRRTRQLLLTAGRSEVAQNSLHKILQYAEKKAIKAEVVSINNDMLAVNYTDITQFGADRFLNLLAAKARYGQNFCVVSCGTAITLDFYTNQHIGGMITPGIGIASQLLATKTGLTNIEKPSELLGNSTATSIGSGIYFGYQNLVYGSIKHIEKTQNTLFYKVFTGGDSRIICTEGDIVPELLFEGMQRYAHYIRINKEAEP